jgi:hypothetical protein
LIVTPPISFFILPTLFIPRSNLYSSHYYRTTTGILPMANLVPAPVYTLLFQKASNVIDRYNALQRYIYAVETELQQAEETIEYRKTIFKDQYMDMRDNSRHKSKKKTDDAKKDLAALRRRLMEFKNIDSAMKLAKYAWNKENEKKLLSIGTEASDLNDALQERITRRDEQNQRRRNDEEWRS